MANQEPCFDESKGKDAGTSNGVSKANRKTEESTTRNAASSENPSASEPDTSCTQHLPCKTQGMESARYRKNTQLNSDLSSRHFLNRDIPSSGEQIIFEFFLDLYGDERLAAACVASFNSQAPESPKLSLPLPPPS